jgi:hypothetical protein
MILGGLRGCIVQGLRLLKQEKMGNKVSGKIL